MHNSLKAYSETLQKFREGAGKRDFGILKGLGR